MVLWIGCAEANHAAMSKASGSSTTTRRHQSYNRRSKANKPLDAAPARDVDICFVTKDGEDLFPRRTLTLDLRDVISITRQLNYMPLNIVSVGAYKPDKAAAAKGDKRKKTPIVAVLYPLSLNKKIRQNRGGATKNTNEPKTERDDDEECGDDEEDESDVGNTNEYKDNDVPLYLPFPTTFWLTDPTINANICKLEETGWISRIQTKLSSSESALNDMRSAHQCYSDFRLSLLNRKDTEYVKEKGWENKLTQVGVAGMANFDSVKCLHCHYAHYATRPQDKNRIGEWVDKLLSHLEDNETNVVPESYLDEDTMINEIGVDLPEDEKNEVDLNWDNLSKSNSFSASNNQVLMSRYGVVDDSDEEYMDSRDIRNIRHDTREPTHISEQTCSICSVCLMQ